MSTRKWIWAAVMILILSLLTPGPYEKMVQAYRTSLWTYDFYKTPSQYKRWHSSRYFVIQKEDHGHIGIEPWHRFRFGFPFRGTTIDSNTVRFLIQGKVQIDFLLINVIVNSLIFLLSVGMFGVYKKLRGKYKAS